MAAIFVANLMLGISDIVMNEFVRSTAFLSELRQISVLSRRFWTRRASSHLTSQGSYYSSIQFPETIKSTRDDQQNY
jgi:hypothetical protein